MPQHVFSHGRWVVGARSWPAARSGALGAGSRPAARSGWPVEGEACRPRDTGCDMAVPRACRPGVVAGSRRDGAVAGSGRDYQWLLVATSDSHVSAADPVRRHFSENSEAATILRNITEWIKEPKVDRCPCAFSGCPCAAWHVPCQPLARVACGKGTCKRVAGAGGGLGGKKGQGAWAEENQVCTCVYQAAVAC